MAISDILDLVSSDLIEVEKVLDEHVQSPIPLAYEISKYLLGSGGKRLRPSVLLLASGACGNVEGKKRIYSAASLELIHTASLLHDDVVDEATLRRGKTSSNMIWGNKPTVLVGDFMLARALNLMQSCGELELIDSVTEAASRLAEGQVLEVMNSQRMIDFTEEVCFGIIENKTASLIESCGRVGAILANVDVDLKNKFSLYGFKLGVAFQLTDDALDYSGNESEFGKEIGHDLLEGKMTLPLYYSLQNADKNDRKRVKDFIENMDMGSGDMSFVFEIVKEYGGVQKTLEKAKDSVIEAKKAIESVPDNEYHKSLDLLAEYVVERNS